LAEVRRQKCSAFLMIYFASFMHGRMPMLRPSKRAVQHGSQRTTFS